MKRYYFLAGILLAVVALAASVVLYPHLPSQVAIHWNIHGNVDGYGDKSYAAFLVPGLMAILLILFRLLPWLSPRHFEIETTRPTYLYVMVVLLALFAYLHALILLASLARPMDVSRSLVGGFFLFFALVGNVLGKIPRNFYVGVRTPWTIADARVWHATHRLAAKLFVAAGALGFLAVLVTGWITTAFVLLMAAILAPVVYSLFYYKRLQVRGEV